MVIWERRYFTFRKPGDLPRRRSSADLSHLPFCGHQYQLGATEDSTYALPIRWTSQPFAEASDSTVQKAVTRPAIAATLITVENKTVGRTLMRSSPVCRYSTGGRAYLSSSASNCFSALATAVSQRSLSEKNLSLSPLAKIVIPPVATAAPP